MFKKLKRSRILQVVSDFEFRISNLLNNKKRPHYALISVLIFIIIVTSIFFYPIFKGDIPFPGDLLVGHHAPYNTQSYNGIAPGGVPHKAQGPDVIRQLYPWKHFVVDNLGNFSIPFWNPHNFSGNPLMANFQSAVFYPINLLYLIMPFNAAWTIFIVLTPILSAFFVYLFLREIKVTNFAAVFAGVVFAFSSYMTVWMEWGNIGHTFIWLPLALYISEKLLKKFSAEYLLSLVGVLFLSFLAGYIQGYFYITIVVGFYFITKSLLSANFDLRKTFIYLSALAFPFFLGMFQLLPTLELFQQSSRGNYSLSVISDLLNPSWYSLTAIAPDIFGNPASRNHWFYGTYIERVSYFGVIPFILALYALFHFKNKKEIIIFGSIFIFTFLLAFDFFVTKYLYLVPIPVISTTVPTRILSLFVFSGSILSGFGLEYFINKYNKKNALIASGIVCVVLGVTWILMLLAKQLFPGREWLENILISERNAILPTAFAIIFLVLSWSFSKLVRYKNLVIIFLFALTLLELFRFFHKITPFSPKEYIYPQTPVSSFIKQKAGIDRYWGYGSGHIDTNFQTYERTYFPNGNDALHIKAYTEFVEASKDGKYPLTVSRTDATVQPGFGPEDMKNNQYRQKVLNILGIKYVMHKNEGLNKELVPDTATFNDAIYDLVWQQTPWQVYENKNSSRVFLTNNYEVIISKEKIFSRFFSSDFDERSSLILDEDPRLVQQELRTKNLEQRKYSPNEVEFETETDAEAMLFLSDTYYPGWKASVDGKETKIYRADYAFRAVKVPEGKHVVKFYYFPDSFKNGLLVSGISLLGLAIYYLIVRKFYAGRKE